jgi:hypothetical protein
MGLGFFNTAVDPMPTTRTITPKMMIRSLGRTFCFIIIKTHKHSKEFQLSSSARAGVAVAHSCVLASKNWRVVLSLMFRTPTGRPLPF